MFENWGFLLGEIWVLLLLAGLLGLLAGWLIWSRSDAAVASASDADLTGRLSACEATVASRDQRISELEAQIGAAQTAAVVDHDDDGNAESDKPQTLDGPRDGQADDLKRIKGVGAKMETMLHDMGFYHFDQIAGWTDTEIAWVDANLTGFKGRASRDNWVEQARLLADGGETDFSKKVDKGEVY